MVFGKVMEPIESRAILEEACHWNRLWGFLASHHTSCVLSLSLALARFHVWIKSYLFASCSYGHASPRCCQAFLVMMDCIPLGRWAKIIPFFIKLLLEWPAHPLTLQQQKSNWYKAKFKPLFPCDFNLAFTLWLLAVCGSFMPCTHSGVCCTIQLYYQPYI